jgi:4-amino-4-deoxy-L-arabinose transferase-like glycosyltransferase
VTIAVILIGTAGRIAFGAMLGLGVDETYMVAAGRDLRLGYFDHPPASWWMAWAGAHLFGTDAPLAVRAPFIALFVATCWLMFLLTRRLFGARAGLFAVLAMNCAPVIGVTAGGWVLPDGPLLFGVAAAAFFLVRALDRNDTCDWVLCGLGAGFALFSKYTAVLPIAGIGLWFVVTAEGRRLLRRPGPWLAVIVAGVMFAPVVWWNATHGWASFAFQGGRAGPARLHPFAPFGVLAGETLFLLPWIGVPLLLLLVGGLRAGAPDRARFLLAVGALPAVVVFPVVALWSSGRVLFHWASPGYLLLFPLLGAAIATRLEGGDRAVRRLVWLTPAFVLGAALLAGTEFRLDWARPLLPALPLRADPNAEAVAWTDLARALPDTPGLLVAAGNWHDAGKVDYALGGRATVLSLDPDARQYGFNAPLARYAGRDAIIVLREGARPPAGSVEDVGAPTPVAITHDGRPVIRLWIARARIAGEGGKR